MSQLTQEQRDALRAAGWTEEAAAGFTRAISTFREGLPSCQRDTFNAFLATAGAAAAADDTQGHLVVIAIIAVLIGLLFPTVQ